MWYLSNIMSWILIGVIFTLAHTSRHRSTFDRVFSTNGLAVDASPIPSNGNTFDCFFLALSIFATYSSAHCKPQQSFHCYCCCYYEWPIEKKEYHETEHKKKQIVYHKNALVHSTWVCVSVFVFDISVISRPIYPFNFDSFGSSILKTNQSIHQTLGSSAFRCEHNRSCTASTWNSKTKTTCQQYNSTWCRNNNDHDTSTTSIFSQHHKISIFCP